MVKQLKPLKDNRWRASHVGLVVFKFITRVMDEAEFSILGVPVEF